MSNYYEEKTKQIKKLLASKQTQGQGLAELRKELQMPYVPAKYQGVFENLYASFTKNHNESKLAPGYVTGQEIIVMLNSQNPEKIAIAIDNLPAVNIHKITSYLQKWISSNKDQKGFNIYFALIYENMVAQNINLDITFNNKTLNPSKHKSTLQNPVVQSAFEEALSHFEKEPHLRSVVLSELELYFLKVFPRLPSNGKLIGQQFANIIHHLFRKTTPLTYAEKNLLEFINNS